MELTPDVFWGMTLYEFVLRLTKGKTKPKAEPISSASDFRSMFNPRKEKRK
jgi:hypothetical protein